MGTATSELADLRDDIDRLDDEIAELVAERIATAERVAAVKTDADLDLVDTDREETVKAHYGAIFERQGLDAETGNELAAFLIDIALEQEREVES